MLGKLYKQALLKPQICRTKPLNFGNVRQMLSVCRTGCLTKDNNPDRRSDSILSDLAFFFCLTKTFRLSDSCPSTNQKILRKLYKRIIYCLDLYFWVCFPPEPIMPLSGNVFLYLHNISKCHAGSGKKHIPKIKYKTVY